MGKVSYKWYAFLLKEILNEFSINGHESNEKSFSLRFIEKNAILEPLKFILIFLITITYPLHAKKCD